MFLFYVVKNIISISVLLLKSQRVDVGGLKIILLFVGRTLSVHSKFSDVYITCRSI